MTISCYQSDNETTHKQEPTLFTLLSPQQTGVDFQNTITEGPNTNVLMYEYFYNGGGVAVGDLNGDKLDDIYFTANLTANKLYLNRSQNGSIKFEDITVQSGAAGREGPWKTGVTMADVNADGKLDIFVCHSGNLPPEKKINELFINQGNNAQGIPTFKDETATYGLDQPTSSTNAYFFDYDRDGDLDLFLLNHNIKSLPVLNESNSAEWIKQNDPISGCKLFQHTANKFVDVTTKSGINSSPLSYGLGAGIADLNRDGWPDIYVSNDYTVPDRLYINQRNGTFKDEILHTLPYTSQFSMGNEVADVNNDGTPDIFTLDMLPEDNRRQKLLMAPDNYEKFDMTVRSGFHKQFMRNMLHLNQATSPQSSLLKKADGGNMLREGFSEIGQLSGIANTDWSWAALFADYDNDGWKDLYITNGYLRDYTNLDFLKYMNDFQQNAANVTREDVLNLVNQMPASNVTNYTFRNNKDLTFSKIGNDWGLAQTSNSNGAVYSDLDNDGDLDLVVNNINTPAFIYQNQGRKDHHYLKIELKGTATNTYGIGAQVSMYANGQVQYIEQMPARGYQSSVSPILHFGLGKITQIDSLRVIWPHGKQQILRQLKADQWLTIEAKNATEKPILQPVSQSIFAEIASAGINYQQPTTNYNDFKRQLLLVNPQSQVGPCLAKADVNADGLEDLFVGGGNGKASALFLQQKNGSFSLKPTPVFEADAKCDATDAVFYDADADADADLYVANGGYANFEANDPALQDVLYINDGKGNFTKAINLLPALPTNTTCVRVGDSNNDKKPDLFVGGGTIPGDYPNTSKSYVLVANSNSPISYTPTEVPIEGIVTDATWIDLNNDKKQELIVVGEWMPITVFETNNGKLENKTQNYFDKNYSGWWNTLLVEDLNNDGKMELVAGNLGLNSQVKASEQQPAELFYKDFDQNGRIDPILCTYIQGKSYPYLTRDELVGQLPIMGKRFPDYKSYADATLNEVFTKDELDGAKHLTANHLKTTLFEQTASGKFAEKPLPLPVQFAPIYAIAAIDFDKDGKKDLVVAGNQLHTRLRLGYYAANQGILLKNNGNNDFSYVPQHKAGFRLNGEVRSIATIHDKVIFGINQQKVQVYRLN